MADRDAIISAIGAELRSGEFRDSSLNGLQVEGSRTVKKAAFGVSASLAFIRAAARWGADLAVVHHGLLWDKTFALKGPAREKISALLEADMSLAAWHLPLDAHPRLGNNAVILSWLGAAKAEPFGVYDGRPIGFKARLKKPLPLAAVKDALFARAGSRALTFAFGPDPVRTAGVVSGGAASMFAQACDEGLDLYITGEANEPAQETARERGANFIAAGHYNSEKAGVRALAAWTERKFKIKTAFLDVPNPV